MESVCPACGQIWDNNDIQEEIYEVSSPDLHWEDFEIKRENGALFRPFD